MWVLFRATVEEDRIPLYITISVRHQRRKKRDWSTIGEGVIWSSQSRGLKGIPLISRILKKDETEPDFVIYIPDTVSDLNENYTFLLLIMQYCFIEIHSEHLLTHI